MSSGSPLRIGLLGAGFIADSHLEILGKMDGIEVIAVLDPAPDRARTLAERWGVPHVVSSIDDLCKTGVDLAHVLTPPDRHVQLTRQLLNSGISAFVEKPLALSSEEARELLALADEKGLVLGANHNHLYQPAFVRLMDKVEGGRIGRVEHVQLTWSVPLAQLEAGQVAHWMFRAPRNIIFEQAVHPLCQVYALIGRVRMAETTLLRSRKLRPGLTFHDRWLSAARGERGTAEIYLAFGEGFARNTIRVLGSDGSLEADFSHDTLEEERKTPWLEFWNSFLASQRRGTQYRRDAWRGLANYSFYTLGLSQRRDAFFVGMSSSIHAFYRALAEGSRPPVDGRAAAEVLEWCEAVAAGVSGEVAQLVPAHQAAPARQGEIVVFGGTGFIGRRVVSRLLDAGKHVTCVVRSSSSLDARLESAAEAGELRLLHGSLEDIESIHRAISDADVVVHLATGGGSSWEAIERSMVGGSVAIAQACLEHGVRRFLYVSSVAALYLGAKGVIEDSRETDKRFEIREIYSRGKAVAERTLFALCETRGLPLVVLRPGVVVGEGTPMQHPAFGLWNRDNHCIGWGKGNHPLPLVWVEDAAEAIARATIFDGTELHGRALNLCARVELTARDIVEELRQTTGRDIHFHPRPLWLSQIMEIGKWVVKLVGRRPGREFPCWHDLSSRAMVSSFSASTARQLLGWQPLEDRETFLDKTIRIYGRSGTPQSEGES